uniref:efflux RND transporter permease subunit n=1 Tax=Ningiella ruwaisensis TaxID=2364274 RepID=UPI001F4F81FE|nr:efflux RND transporter permease subunit [Ningiella ruwaisensis]
MFEFRSTVFLTVVLLMAFGLYSYFNLPAREDPSITIRVATVTASNPNMSAERMELLVTKTLEEVIREQGEVEEVTSITQPGLSIIKVEIQSKYFQLEQIWDDIRDRMATIQKDLPPGTSTPVLNDDFGNVAAATIALQSDDYSMAEQFDMAQYLRDKLYQIPNTKTIDILGAQPERVYIQLSNTKFSTLGISPRDIQQSLSQQNIIEGGGQLDTGVTSYILQASGTFKSLEDIQDTLIAVPNQNIIVALKDVAHVYKDYIEPPSRRTYFNGKPAIMLALTMVPGNSVLDYGKEANMQIEELRSQLPAGYTLSIATFQSDQVADAVFGVTSNVIQTLFIVLAVVIFFLGLRTGLIVGAIVPSVMLITIAIMGFFEINLQRMSLATLVISLGLLVDNGIVIAEDFKRRLDEGEERKDALGITVKELALPLLSSTLTTILVFLPLMLAEHESGEYTRTISQVVLISLATSWVLAMTLTPVLCTLFIKAPEKSSKPGRFRQFGIDSFDYLNKLYANILYRLLKFRRSFLAVMLLLFIAAIGALQLVPQNFFPNSDRSQLLIYFDLPAGVTETQTDKELQAIFAFLDDDDKWPEIESTAGYTGFGGPRFVLSLAPIDPAPNRGFAVLNIDRFENVDPVKLRLRKSLAERFPQVKAQVTNMFLGPSDPTIFEVEVSGPDAWVVFDTANKVKGLLSQQAGAVDIRSDWENRALKYVIDVEQAKAKRAGISTADINQALKRHFNGQILTHFYDGDDVYPIMLRAPAKERDSVNNLKNISVFSSLTNDSVLLSQVAKIRPENEYVRIARVDAMRTATVSARNDYITAQDWAPIMEKELDKIRQTLPVGHSIDLSGIVVTSEEGRAALAANMPLCLALVLILLVAQFNGFKRPFIIILTLPLMLIGAVIGLHVMRADFGFMVILGLYALLGIIINNAIVLVDRIDIERKTEDSVEAVIKASVMRLRPIIMTTITTILGLLPLIISVDPLFYGLAVVLAFGLAMGTFLTLGVAPVLYCLMFDIKAKHEALSDTTIAIPTASQEGQ